MNLRVFIVLFMSFIAELCFAHCTNDACNSWCQGNEYQAGGCTPVDVLPDKQTCVCYGEQKPNWPRD